MPCASSARSCSAAHGRRPVRGSVRPTGFSVPKRGASCPLRAISSMGWHAWNRSCVSKSRWITRSAPTSASTNASYSSRVNGAFR